MTEPSSIDDLLLAARGIMKRFPGVVALDGVDFTLRAGEIHALMGENGAGKSTLIKVLTGVYPRDAGELRVDGVPARPASPREAEDAGLSTVHQEVSLIPGLSVAENILLGRQPRRARWFLDWRALHRRAASAMERIGLGEIDLRQPAGACSLAVQQMVAIARALDTRARVLILDEPTSSLDEAEVERLFAVMRRLRDEGMGIVFVTHFLDQVYAVSDRITVLRNGALVGEYAASRLPRLALVEKMLGRRISGDEVRGGIAGSEAPATPGVEDSTAAADVAAPAGAVSASGAPILAARRLERRGSVGPLDLEVRGGEALGLAGLLGSGRTETVRLLFGADRRTGGTVELGGRPAPLRSPREAIARGVAFCSEDRRREGIVPTLSVRENLLLALQASRGFLRRIPSEEQERLVETFIARLGIRTPSPEAPVETLSGGNQQKVLLARWLCLEPSLLVLDEPTRGIDVGTKAEIEKLIDEWCARGLGVVFVSSELEEIVRTCRRVAVLRDRRKVAELTGSEVAVDPIMHAIAGHDAGGADPRRHGNEGERGRPA